MAILPHVAIPGFVSASVLLAPPGLAGMLMRENTPTILIKPFAVGQLFNRYSLMHFEPPYRLLVSRAPASADCFWKQDTASSTVLCFSHQVDFVGCWWE